ncbi:helix-turn-helix domain-containing protein [Trichocoleus sp. FACHB-262]|uniref:helix-turn-helix domain-containing protein n=1 Tax=Trichocoleus sp. FACHB-262 TaxID=2692869 RepID=UPI001689B6CE|nr:helix-turn-helix domain-containing protein [Trichocoleus sp. FACHB-262]MBD2123410.1 helix-turn-helix domain-containing protein [Trichocoleus sp. FACHB-262]
MSLRDLGQREIALLKLYTRCQLGMSPQEFYAKWSVTHAQMAQICGCSEPTVDRWFAKAKNYRPPEAVYLRRLAEMNLLWESYEQVPPALRQVLCPPTSNNGQELSP